LTPDRAGALCIDPLLAPIDVLLSSRIDPDQREVEARLPGTYRRRADVPARIDALTDRLFRPPGMNSAILEVDSSGTFPGSSCM
jgi:hypothetical protein